jgi:hypothetical protein
MSAKKSVLQELMESGCDEKLLRSAAQYLAKPKGQGKKVSIPRRKDINVLFEAADQLERFCREILLFEMYGSFPGDEFVTVTETIKALRFQARLAINLTFLIKKSLNPNLRGFAVKALSDHVRKKTGKANWNRLARLIEEFGGEIDAQALIQLRYNFEKSPASKLFD